MNTMLHGSLLVLAAILSFGPRIRAATTVSGLVEGTWTMAGSPYRVVNDAFVGIGRTLAIQPGVVVEFQDPDDALVIDGTLVAVGTPVAPIRFTSDDPAKAPGQWEAVIFRASATSTNSLLEQCILEYGGGGGAEEILRIENASPVVRNCIIRQGRMHGLKVVAADPRIEQNQFLNNGGAVPSAYAMMVRADSLPRCQQNVASGNQHNAIGIYGGFFSRTGTWYRDGIPYSVVEDLFVAAGRTLTIEAGTVVQFQDPDDALVIDGAIVARGSEAQPIVFTSDDPVKAPGQWEAIIFRDGSDDRGSLLERCVIEHGGAGGAEEMVRIENASPTIRGCTFQHSRFHGAKLVASDPVMEECRFLDNGFTNLSAHAVMMRADSFPGMSGNSASGNIHDAIGVYGANVSRSGTWRRDGMPYTILEDTYIWLAATLTIDPGVTVQFQDPDDALVVDGALVAVGTVEAPILFTSDDVEKKPGQWEAIVFRDSSKDATTILDHCIVECGGAGGAEELIRFETASPTVQNSILRHSRMHGAKLVASDPRISGCEFVRNGETNPASYSLMMRGDSLPWLSGNHSSGSPHNAIGVYGGNFNRTGTWFRDGMPYTVVDDLFIWSNRTLTIEPGVVVQFQDPDDALIVDGALVARGTVALPVRFTSDDAIKAPGQWESILFRSTSDDAACVLDHCLIEYGGRFSEGMLAVVDASPDIRNCEVRGSLLDGIYCSGASPSVTACRITNHGRDGVRTANKAAPRISQSVIAMNGGLGIRNMDTTVVPARNNYWGDPTGPLDTANIDGLGLLNPSGLGQSVSEYVDWAGFATVDSTGCVPVPAGLVAWWSGEGNAVDRVGGFDGVPRQGVTFGPGVSGQAFVFDGLDDFIETTLDVQPSFLPETTWEAWVFPTRIHHGVRQQLLSADNGGYDRSLLIESGTDSFGVFTGAGVWKPAPVTLNEWQHVAVVYGTDAIRFYKNGEESVLGAKPVGQATSNRLRIGSNPSFGEYFQGRVDEVSIYGRALSAAEIRAIHDAGAGGKCVSAPVAGPSLRVERSGTDVVVSWAGSETGWRLESTTSLAPKVSWVPVATVPVLTGGRWTVSGAAKDSLSFFRLFQP